jgi:hypothetical protein
MSRISSLIEGIGSFAEGRLPQRMVQEPAEAPSKARAMSSLDELNLLEKEAHEKGISHDELNKTRQIGDCAAQVQTRVKRLHEWLAAH